MPRDRGKRRGGDAGEFVHPDVFGGGPQPMQPPQQNHFQMDPMQVVGNPQAAPQDGMTPSPMDILMAIRQRYRNRGQ